jgi:predicted TPR repeat methyltransferase
VEEQLDMKLNHVNQMIDYYSSFSERWEKEYKDQKQNDTEMTAVRMAKYLNKKSIDDIRILDAACGTGLFGLSLEKKNIELTGVDASLAMTSYAKDRNYDKIIISDLIKYFKDCKTSYDVVIVSDAMMIYPSYKNEPIFWGAAKVLKQKGMFIFNANLSVNATKKEHDDRVELLRTRSKKYGFKISEEFSGLAYVDDVSNSKVITHIFVAEKI